LSLIKLIGYGKKNYSTKHINNYPILIADVKNGIFFFLLFNGRAAKLL